MPIDINDLCEGWLELESDPGLFTLLLEDLGVCGVQVEEIYDLQKPVDGPVLGFIFLFRWTEERRSRRKTNSDVEQFVRDEKIVNTMFFAHQVVPNSCATHALLSVLLNCSQVTLGPTLSRLKVDTAGMSPDNKGLAIGNTPELARAHNSHAVPQPPRTACDRNERNSIGASGRYSAEAFHFVSYVPINGRLYELDGLKSFPIDHGQWAPSEDWTELFRRVILERIGSATSGGEPCHDIRFSLMVVVPDKRLALSQRLRLLKTNKKIVVEALQQLMSATKSKAELAEVKPVNESLNIEVDSGEGNPFRAPLTTALTIQTSPVPSTSSYSTDTASETGSAFNSPTDNNHHATSDLSNSAYVKDFSRLVVVKMGCQKPERLETCDEGGSRAENGLLLPAAGSPKQEPAKEMPSADLSATSAPTSTSSPTPVRTPTPTITTTTPSSTPTPASTASTPSPTPSTAATSVFASATVTVASPSTSNAVTTTTAAADSDSVVCGVNDSEPAEPIPSRDDAPTSSPSQQQRFGTRDLIALLKSLEKEIDTTEGLLLEEGEKRKKYRIDDSRRIHNYDEFICTFLSMLAEQGTLASLVEQHTTGRKRLHRGPNSVASSRHKRGRPRYKRRR